jgi:hypothetical protein
MEDAATHSRNHVCTAKPAERLGESPLNVIVLILVVG